MKASEVIALRARVCEHILTLDRPDDLELRELRDWAKIYPEYLKIEITARGNFRVSTDDVGIFAEIISMRIMAEDI